LTYKEIDYVINEFPNLVLNTKIGSKSTTAGGTEHPLWTLLNDAFSPAVAWKSLRPRIRTQVVNAGKYLHGNNIPYGFYINFLKLFKKGYLKKTPLILLTYKQKNINTPYPLNEFIICFKLAEDCFKQNPEILKINDKIHEQYPNAFETGYLSYIHSLILIKTAIAKYDTDDIYEMLKYGNSQYEFWNILGKTITETENKPLQIDLSKGTTNQKDITLLKNEMLTRTGKNQGKPNPTFNKYFKINGTLNATGIKVVSGEKAL
jgi:hypothetical protein